MVEIRKFNVEEIKILADMTSDKKTKEQLNMVYDVMSNKKKYITKTKREELENLGFIINGTYLSKESNYVLNLKSGEIDILNGDTLRIGLSRIDKFNPRWYELKLNKKIGE